ncbi:phosphatidylserine/phosphatidylglycerophosphate/cardiolipin synthase family protein [Lysinibacillus pakistanensis]|uniref:phosphatidylserine/phosphatidylglycerophosphate/ cardiolipin synthase family protein n=1 Tax=Lysinibacillus pakistanensis TaxID=759811 RepID=UPI003D299177
MKKIISNIMGELILTYQENGYQEVLDTFTESDYINIATFNINSFISNSYLIHGLREIDVSTPVTLILNVPEGDYYHRRINYILMLLERERFGNLNVYFNFSNHAKLIMTNKIAYIGSQNFSDASRNNYELGILVRELEQVQKIESEIFEELKNNSVLYSTSEYNVRMEELSSLLNGSIKGIRQQIFTVYGDGYPVPEQEILDIHQAYFDKNNWRKFEELYANFEEVINEIIDGYQEVLDQEAIQSYMNELNLSITQFISELEELSNFSIFQEESMMWEKFYENDTGDNLDYHMEKAVNVVREIKEEEFHQLEDLTDILISLFDSIEEQIQNVMDRIYEIREEMISRTLLFNETIIRNRQ